MTLDPYNRFTTCAHDQGWLRDARGENATCVLCGEKRSVASLLDSGLLVKSMNGRGPSIDLESLHKSHGRVNVAWGGLCRLLDDIAEARDS